MIQNVREVGQRGLLIEVGAERDRPSLSAHLHEHPLAGQVEVIPGIRTVLVDFRRRRDAQAAVKQAKKLKVRRRKTAELRADAAEAATPQIREVPRSYAQSPVLDDREAVVEVLRAVQDGGVLIQDTGRYGFGAQGVGRSGTVDRAAGLQANRLVGNDDSAAVFEVRGEFSVRICQTSILAVTGAEVALEVITEEPVPISRGAGEMARTSSRSRVAPMRAPFWVFPGEVLHLGSPSHGVYSYMGVSGGLDAPLHLGSASTDTSAGIGPEPVRPGQRFALLGAASRFVGIASVAPTPLPPVDGATVLRYVPGPRAEHFGTRRASSAGLLRLEGQPWEVLADASRLGLTLEGDDPVRRTQEDELPAEPVMRGAICIPASGHPHIALAEHPVTSSDPTLGVVVREDLALAAQLRSGAEVRFQAVDPETLGAIRTR